jgi:hypothetical protein
MERIELFFNPQSVSPTLFIGLGGSGSAIVDRVADKLMHRWNFDQYRDLVHFFAVDTNIADLERVTNVPPANRLLISDFDKRAYVEQKRGKTHMPKDPFCTQWIPDWYDFRASRGSGAGQVRIESRLSLYYQLERDRGEIIRRVNEAIYRAKDHDNPFRRSSPRKFQVFIFGSVAGGTGSGSFLSLAYLLHELIDLAGWIPQIHATLLMPSLFHRVVKGALKPDIDANGYAALKELEALMKLGYEAGPDELEFHYNPMKPEATHVARNPFSFVYLVDLPAVMSIAPYREAIADATYLQLFSPIIGTQQGEYDNYEKHQKTLAHGYAVHYGSFGCSMLVLPDDDLLEYCAQRYAKKAMEAYLTFQLPERAGEAAKQFAINYDDPRFKAMTDDKRAQVIDDKFREFVRYLGRVEQDSDNPEGPFSTIVRRCERRDKKSQSLPAEFDRMMEGIIREGCDLIDLHMITPVDITAKNIKVDAEVDDLRDEIAQSRSAVKSFGEAHKRSIENGNFLRAFFEQQKVDPFCQRYFLIGLCEHLRGRISDLDGKRDELARYAIDSESVVSELKAKKDLLHQTAEYTFFERLKRRNEDFEQSRAAFVRFFNEELQQVNRMLLETDLRRELFSALFEAANNLLDVYRTVTARSAEIIARLSRECERLLKTASSSRGRSEAQEFVLDVEVLQDFSGRRYWDAYFDEMIGSGEAELAMFDRDAILQAMNKAFAPQLDERGQRLVPTADVVAEALQQAFVGMGKAKLSAMIKGTRRAGPDRKLKGLLLDDALRLEARYCLTAQLRKDRSKREPTEAMIDSYIVDKLRHCVDKSAVLATIDETLGSDEAVVAANDIFLVGLHEHFRGDGDGVLERLVDKAATGASLIEDWHDEKRIVIYKAVLGVPLYFYKRVNGEMREAYRRVSKQKNRSYPLHIEAAWEEQLGDLDPIEKLEAERMRAREGKLESFVWCWLGGAIVETEGNEGQLSWSYGDHGGALGAVYGPAFEGFSELDRRTAERLSEVADATREAAEDGDEALAAALSALRKRLDDHVWSLEQRKRRKDKPELRFLEQLLAVLRRLDDELDG